MRRLFLVVAVFSVVIALPVSVGARARPTITVTRVVPLTVKGANFVPGERVTLTAQLFGTNRTKIVTAGRRGSFLAIYRFASGKCVGIRVVARGNKGSRATAYVPPSCRV
jgi:hypothetical protein